MSDFPPAYGSSFSMRSTPASHSARRSTTSASNRVWGLTKTDDEWSGALDAALTATRRGDLEHGTNAAYVAGCVCKSVENTSASG